MKKYQMEECSDYHEQEISGDCATCGEWAGHLIDGMCEPCRERYQPDEIARRAGV